MLTSGVVFLHDNALPHTADRIRARLEHFNWQVTDHSPYSPDLASSDHHMFTRTYVKNWLESQSFNNNQDLIEEVKTWRSSGGRLLDTGIYKLISR
jgi:histone-lysine N-methyltransferase SETMAR